MRLEASELSEHEHLNKLVTISSDTGESITMTLVKIDHSGATTTLRGRALGQTRGVLLPPWEVVHVYADEHHDRRRPTMTATLDALGIHRRRP